MFLVVLILCLLAFQIFNFSTTEYALYDVLGPLTFVGVKWSVILAIAFCAIDFAGVARLFTPEHGRDEPAEVWYLFGAFVLAAAMNACFTWWGVAVALKTASDTVRRTLPVAVALVVWVVRIVIIGALSLTGDRLMSARIDRKLPPRRK